MHKERLQIHNNKEQEHFVIFNLNDDIDDNDIQEGSFDFQKQGEGGGCHLLIKKFHCKFVFILRLRKRQHFVKQCNIFFPSHTEMYCLRTSCFSALGVCTLFNRWTIFLYDCNCPPIIGAASIFLPAKDT